VRRVSEKEKKEKRVPCTKEMSRYLRTVYATARKRLAIRNRRVPHSSSRACLSRWIDHRFAILVDNGSDPTVPYQALVIRESARLFSRVRPLGT